MKSPLFEQVQMTKVKSNVFDLGHEKKLSCNMGQLVPILVQEVLPGDKFKCNTEILMRLAPMVSPVMHRVNVFTHFFFVPNRLIWTEWEDFITGGKDGLQAPAMPTMTFTDANKSNLVAKGLADHMGIPPYTTGTWRNNMVINALPFRAYQLIYDTYYRDQKLSTEIGCLETSGALADPEIAKLCAIRTRAWEKDYFTSAQTSTQLGTAATVQAGTGTPTYLNQAVLVDTNGDPITANAGALTINSSGELLIGNSSSAGSIENLDYTTNSPISVNDLRRAFRLQVWLEKNARAGWRYVEQLLSHFGVRLDDYRAQRPVYLGGGKQPVVISEVLNTSATATEPQGNMAGHGISVGGSNYFQEDFQEHGWIIGIMSTLPRTCYMQGIDKSFLKVDKFDYYFPEFANLGEQEIDTKELYADWCEVYDPNGTFGYQSRYSEYKFKNSIVTGDFRSTLDHWHMARKFTTCPVLNESFIQAQPTHEIFAVTDTAQHKLYVQLYNDLKAIRLMPVFGTPDL